MDGIDITSFLDTYGLPGLMILVLLWVGRALWVQLNQQIAARFDDHKTHSAQMADVTKTLDQAIRYVEGAGRG